jgi:folate-binding protein YgfZ
MSLLLANRRLISVKGQGVLGFLQGLVTQDTELLKRQGTFAAACLFLNAKGRVMADAIMVKANDSEILLDVPKLHYDLIANHLTRHKLRLPLNIEKLTDMGVFAFAHTGELRYQDPRSARLPQRVISSIESGSQSDEEPSSYRKERFRFGIVESQDIPADSIPIFYNFDLLNAIAFAKGCYSGQELVTRTLRRGVVRKRVVPIQCDKGIGTGSPVSIEGNEVGLIIAAQDDVGLALIQFDSPVNELAQLCTAARTLGEKLVQVGGNEGKIVLPTYCLE